MPIGAAHATDTALTFGKGTVAPFPVHRDAEASLLFERMRDSFIAFATAGDPQSTALPSWHYPGRTSLVLFRRSPLAPPQPRDELPLDMMPVWKPSDQEGDDWWAGPRRYPFGRRFPFGADEIACVPWPSEADALDRIRAMDREQQGHYHPDSAMVERPHIFHGHHPSEAVRLQASCVLQKWGKSYNFGFGKD